MGLAHWINTLFDKKYKVEWIPKDYRDLIPSMYDVFKANGEGVYESILQSTGNDFAAKMIAFFSGKFSHCFHMFYSEDLRGKLTNLEYVRIINNWERYYGISEQEAEEKFQDVKILVLGSADKNGMNYPNYSTYQSRKQCIRKLYTTPQQNIDLLKWYLNPTVMSAIYDYTGLTFWWLFKIFDDERAYYCSEIIKDAGDKIEYAMCNIDEPSPTQIYNYIQNGKTVFEDL